MTEHFDSGHGSDDWGSWESHRLRTLVLALDATPAQRLAWLEEVIALAYATGALPRAPSYPP
jgi:hypothetical protein